MAIHHDAYLFQPFDLAAAVEPYLTALGESQEAFNRLRSEVSRLFNENPQVREIAGEYGAWDKQGVMESMSEDPIYNPQAIGFLLIFLVYASVQGPKPHFLGLRGESHLLRQVLADLGWDAYESKIAVYGHDFHHFAEKWLYKDAAHPIPDYWNHVDPMSTGGRAGWLDKSDVQFLCDKLIKYEDRILNFKLDPSKEVIEGLYRFAKEMYTQAIINNTGLCLIVSG
jgi:hypothetical protein